MNTALKLKPTRKPDDPWHEVEVNRLLSYQRWSDHWKKRMGFAAGLKVLKLRWTHPDRPAKKYWTLTVASRHWPHLLCWSWLLDFRLQRGKPFEYRRFFSFTHYNRQWSLRVLWLFDLHWHSQGYEVMAAEPFKAQAPKVYPLHEGEARTRVE